MDDEINVKNLKFLDEFQKISSFNVRDDDVWICSYAKCGTTWTQEMVWLIENNLDYEGAKQDLSSRSPFFEFSLIQKLPENSPDSPFNRNNTVNIVDECKSPRYIKTHLPWNLLPKQIQNFEKNQKIIYVMRNSKDVCTSYYYHFILLRGFKGDFDQFCQLFLDEKLTYGNYWEHILSFWNNSNKSNIFFIKYEDMVRNLAEIIRKISNFLGKKLNNEEIEILEKHLSFESMKDNSAVNKEKIMKIFRKKYQVDDNLKFLRNGKIGDYKTVMSAEFVKKFDQLDRKYFKNINLTF